MRKAVFLLLLAVAAGLAAQEKAMEVSAPFVSRLKAKAGQASIMLTWRESPDLKGPRLVYRSRQEINEKSFPRAELVARLEPSVNSYEDSPPDRKPYFYAVLLEDARGRIQKLFIPFRNKTSAAVQIGGAAAAAAPAAPEETLSARITELSAALSDDSVRLRFKVSRVNRDLLLFRSTTPMSGYEDLLAAATRVSLNAGSTGYVDYPFPGLDYYYAVVDAGSFKSGKVALVPRQNSTAAPVQVPLGTGRTALPPVQTAIPLPPSPPVAAEAAPGGEKAAAPAPAAAAVAPAAGEAAARTGALEGRAPSPLLPLLALNFDLAAGGQLPPASTFVAPQSAPAPLSPSTQRAAAVILSATLPLASRPRLEPAALPEDQSSNGDPEAEALQAILLERLLPGDYAGAESALSAFLAVRRSPAAAARAYFYLGQVYYMQGKYEQACLELLQAQDRYYSEVQPWIESCLEALRLD